LKKKIKFLVMDVDGTLTDGKIYMGQAGEMMKAFSAKDGAGIATMLEHSDIIPVIITGRESDIVSNRCIELRIQEVYQGIKDKDICLSKILKKFNQMDGKEYTFENVAYIGDDINDLPCMLAVKKAGGIVACPMDAEQSVKEIADFICKREGGRGAVRDLIDWIMA